jgi:hypothetical protein
MPMSGDDSKMVGGNSGNMVMGQKMKEEPEGTDMGDAGSTVLSLDKFPQLQGLESGAKVSGKWEGIIGEISDNNVKIDFSNLELETENSADVALNKMISRGNESKGKDQGGSDDEQDY